MSKHTTNEIPYGYCHCGCGLKTNIAKETRLKQGWVKGEPLRFVFGHQHRHGETEPPNPSGLCMCGCGKKTQLAQKTDRRRGWVRGHPILYILGHQKHDPILPAPEFCACGCGQPIKKAKKPSQQSRFISGHNNRQPVEPRFWARVDKRGSDDCWEWTAGTGNHGYGTLSINGQPETVHRLSWVMANGPIPDDLHVLHKCDNRLCVNPAHLFLGTNLDNIEDMITKGRQAKGPDKRAYKGEANKRAVLSAEQVKEIRRRCANGENQDELARVYGVSQGHISNVYRRVTWKHID